MIVRAAGAIAVVLLLAGCGSAKKEAGGTTTSGCQPLAGADRTSRTSPALEQRETMYLTDVIVQTLDCTDRVVFAFRKGTPGPGYQVSYEPAASAKIEDGSGNPIDVAGSAFLVVRIQPAATAEMNGDKLKLTYTGPRRLTPSGAHHVKEVVKTGDFEAVVTWVIGLAEKRPFTAEASASQLVVDLG